MAIKKRSASKPAPKHRPKAQQGHPEPDPEELEQEDEETTVDPEDEEDTETAPPPPPPAASAKGKSAVVKRSTPTDTYLLMLGNKCQRYMTSGGVLYEAGIKYRVTEAQRKALFDLYDENGIRYFYDAEVIMRQIEASRRKGRRLPEGTRVQRGEGEGREVDTGAVRLRDEDDDPVGVRGDGDSVAV